MVLRVTLCGVCRIGKNSLLLNCITHAVLVLVRPSKVYYGIMPVEKTPCRWLEQSDVVDFTKLIDMLASGMDLDIALSASAEHVPLSLRMMQRSLF